MDLPQTPDSPGVHPDTMPATTRSTSFPLSNTTAAIPRALVEATYTANAPKHSWTVAEDAAVSACYLAGMSIEDTCAAFPHLNRNSVSAKYRNCEYLANPTSPSGFSHVSRQHAAVWKSIGKDAFTNKRRTNN